MFLDNNHRYTPLFVRSFHRILTINLDLIVLQCLARLISGNTGISPSILFFSIKNLQRSSTCERISDERLTKDEPHHTIFFQQHYVMHM